MKCKSQRAEKQEEQSGRKRAADGRAPFAKSSGRKERTIRRGLYLILFFGGILNSSRFRPYALLIRVYCPQDTFFLESGAKLPL